jgi:hypothetical protein
VDTNPPQKKLKKKVHAVQYLNRMFLMTEAGDHPPHTLNKQIAVRDKKLKLSFTFGPLTTLSETMEEPA